jgi:acetyl-CoA carboxylase biotin carboxyl carrier protein
VNTERILTLIDLVADTGMSELEITEAGDTLRIVRNDTASITAQPSTATTTATTMTTTDAVNAPASVATSATIAPVKTPATNVTINAPMSGVFYRSASPGGDPLSDVGSQVEAGTPVCIIEAMKMMTEIEAETSGVIDRILCENGEFVERGQALFTLK